MTTVEPSPAMQTTATRNDDLRLKTWMVAARRLVENLLEMKRRVQQADVSLLTIDQASSVKYVIGSLEQDLHSMDELFKTDRNLQAKCRGILFQLQVLFVDVQGKDTGDTVRPPRPPTSPVRSEITPPPDAELAIRGPDGKKMYFKSRAPLASPSSTFEESAIPSEYPPIKADIRRFSSPVVLDHVDMERSSSPTVRVSMAHFRRLRWPETLLFRATRVQRRYVFARLEENDELHQLILSLYRPVISQTVVLVIPLAWLAWVLPPSVVWYRTAEVQRHQVVTDHWNRCLDSVLKCCVWKSTGDIELAFPIQHREARMLAYRSYAILYGLLSVRILHDYSMKIVYLNARTSHTMTLVLTEKAIVRCLGDGIRDLLGSSMTRRVVYERVCEKLFVEYTSRGFELLFPGVNPKGAARRHPMEISIERDAADYAQREYQRLREVMGQCISQVATIARRRMDEYWSRMQRLRKERQEQAARRIQSRTKGLMTKRRLRRQREDQRRVSRVQNLAASLIQQRYRQNQEMERQRRLRAVERRNRTGTWFRVACRIHQSFMLATVRLDEIDVAANVFDCIVRVVHPVSSQSAQLRVSHATLQRLLGDDSRAMTRREIVDTLLRQHLDVFRSAQHHVLVLSLRRTDL
ncbi:hypothetical protein PINS_up010399 [Pythium insidiosum]|nr:hypothetical protein PINS_up010399 [Pythium insidiosum]